MADDSELKKDRWYQKKAIQRLVEESNGHTIFDDRQDPNRARDPYSPSRDLTYYMKIALPQILDDMLTENMSPTANDIIGKSGFTNHRLLEGFNSLVDSINGFVGKGRDHVGQTLDEVFEENGYAALEPELKLVLEATMGRLFIAAFFFAARCLTPVGGQPLGNIGYGGTFDFMANEVKQAMDGVETPYARKLKSSKNSE